MAYRLRRRFRHRRNKLYLEENGKGVFLDLGENFGKYGIIHEEFLKN